MSRKPLRMLMCAAVAAALGMFGTGAQATFYSGDFDPPPDPGHFLGSFTINQTGDCSSSESETCSITIVQLSINSGTFGNGWTTETDGNIFSGNAIFDGHLIAFDSVLIPLDQSDTILTGPGLLRTSTPQCAPFLKFTSVFGTIGDHSGFVADVECSNGSNVDTAVYSLTQVPEPGTLVLLLGGLGAGWLTRRRNAAS